jgi:hypothetical protein
MAETRKLYLASDRPMRILVVHPQVGSEVGRLLARDGHDVLELGSEERPRRMLGVFVPDLILILCPEPARVCRELREAAPGGGDRRRRFGAGGCGSRDRARRRRG